MNKFRGISIQNTLRRLFSAIINKRLDYWCEISNIYMNSQYGFRRNKSITQPCQILQTLQWLSKTRKKDIYVTFLDISKAYDSVRWEVLWEALQHYGIPHNIIKCLQSMYKNGSMRVHYSGMKGEWFGISIGLPQGDPLSPLLFSIYLTYLFRDYMQILKNDDNNNIEKLQLQQYKLEKNEMNNAELSLYTITDRLCIPKQQLNNMPQILPYRRSNMINRKAKEIKLEHLLYADDCAVFSSSLKGAKISVTRHIEAGKLGKLEVNADKFSFMKVTHKNNDINTETLNINGKIIKEVKTEKYLGSIFTNIYDGGEKNIITRVAIAVTKIKKYENILKNKSIDYHMKFRIYRSEVLPILLHGAEYWHNNITNMDKLEKFQRKAILEIVGRDYRDGIRSVDMYSWLHDIGIEIYPIKYEVADRKLRYFAGIENSKDTDLAKIMYWVDFKSSEVKEADFEYQHIQDIKRALTTLNISEEIMNVKYNKKNEWREIIKGSKIIEFRKWSIINTFEYFDKKFLEIINGNLRKEIEKEISKNNGWMYERRTMPSKIIA